MAAAGVEIFEATSRKRMSVAGASGALLIAASKIGRLKVISGTAVAITVYNNAIASAGTEVWAAPSAGMNAGDQADIQCPLIAPAGFRIQVTANGPAEIDVTYDATV